MKGELNLATRPFRNETLPRLLLVVSGVLLLAVTAVHAVTLHRLAARDPSALQREVGQIEESIRAAQERQRVAGDHVDGKSLKEWAFIKGLVDRRVFSWTGLLARLEEVVPAGVRIVSIAHESKGGRMVIKIDAVTRSAEDGLEFVRRLEARPEFDDVYPLMRRDDRGGTASTRYEMFYAPVGKPVGTSSAPEHAGDAAAAAAEEQAP